MKSVWKVALLLGMASSLVAAEKPDVQTIVNKANIVAYYQGKDGKATVKMTITSKQGQVRTRDFNILRKDVKDGGDQKYFVYFQKPADVRKMVYLVDKHTDKGRDDDRWLYMPGLDLVKRIAASDKRTSFVGSDFLYEYISGRSLDDDTHELIETTEKLFVVKNVPKEPDSVEFGYYSVSIDRKTYVPVKTDSIRRLSLRRLRQFRALPPLSSRRFQTCRRAVRPRWNSAKSNTISTSRTAYSPSGTFAGRRERRSDDFARHCKNITVNLGCHGSSTSCFIRGLR